MGAPAPAILSMNEWVGFKDEIRRRKLKAAYHTITQRRQNVAYTEIGVIYSARDTRDNTIIRLMYAMDAEIVADAGKRKEVVDAKTEAFKKEIVTPRNHEIVGMGIEIRYGNWEHPGEG